MRGVSFERVIEGLSEGPLGGVRVGVGSAGDRSGVLIKGYQIDSRRIEAGELFFALRGQKTDGHQFLEAARKNGAASAVVDQTYQGPDFGLILLPVKDVLLSLQSLAKYFMKDCKATVIAVTGSVGKTTTKEFIATLLEKKYRLSKTYMNYNTKLTCPITLLNRCGDEEILVVEMGMTEPGEISRLVEIAAPDLAVLTKIAHGHICNFANGLSDIAKYKADIFSHPKTKVAIFDHDLYAFPEAMEKIHAEALSFSLVNKQASYYFGSDFLFNEKNNSQATLIPPYRHSQFLHNFVAAVAVARQMGMSFEEIRERIKFLKQPKMRFEMIEKEGVLLINDAYNANPDSMRSALSELGNFKEKSKRIAVLGMMADMGEKHDELHLKIGCFAQETVDHLFVFGKEAIPIYEGFSLSKKPVEQFFDYDSLANRLKMFVKAGDVVLFKASRCVEMEKLISLIC